MASEGSGSGGSSSVHHGGQEVVEHLAELDISKDKNVSGGSSSSVGGQSVVKSQRRKQRRKIKALLRAELEAKNLGLLEMMTDDPGTSLPDEILEDIFLRLPFFDLRSVKQVCKTASVPWNSTRYVRDSSNKAFRWSTAGFKKKIHCTITSGINGLVTAVIYGKVYVCNIFANTWEGVPSVYEDYRSFIDETAIFDLGGGHYKLVYWSKILHPTSPIMTSKILILELGGGKKREKKWCEAYSDRGMHYTDPAVIGSSMFCVDPLAELLVEYNHEADKVKFTRIKPAEVPHELFQIGCLGLFYLIVWQGKLHLLRQHRKDTVDVWQISTADGRAAFLHRFRMGERVKRFDVFEVDDEGVLQCRG